MPLESTFQGGSQRDFAVGAGGRAPADGGAALGCATAGLAAPAGAGGRARGASGTFVTLGGVARLGFDVAVGSSSAETVGGSGGEADGVVEGATLEAVPRGSFAAGSVLGTAEGAGLRRLTRSVTVARSAAAAKAMGSQRREVAPASPAFAAATSILAIFAARSASAPRASLSTHSPTSSALAMGTAASIARAISRA